MKFLNDFKNVFAIVGVVSLIFWTCASESTSDDSSSNLPPQITEGYGKYQVESFTYSNNSSIVVLNTETGVMKTFFSNNLTSIQWAESPDGYYAPITFTH